MKKDDYEELLELCRAILPKTWNVYGYYDVENYKAEKGILNIQLHRYDAIRRKEWLKDGNYKNINNLAAGHVRHIRYLNGVGYIKISLHCAYPIQEPSVLLHELAHVVIQRRASFINKPYKESVGFANGRLIENDMHGLEFLKVLNMLKDKAIKKGYTMFNDYEVLKGGALRPKRG